MACVYRSLVGVRVYIVTGDSVARARASVSLRLEVKRAKETRHYARSSDKVERASKEERDRKRKKVSGISETERKRKRRKRKEGRKERKKGRKEERKKCVAEDLKGSRRVFLFLVGTDRRSGGRRRKEIERKHTSGWGVEALDD